MKKSCLILLFFAIPVQAERIKDLVSIAGVRSNQLIGYGIVVGLNGTGDQTSQSPFTGQSLKNMLKQFGITLPPNASLQPKNIAAVSVHASLPAFAKQGQSIDVTVSSIANAKSLRGGTLLMTPLKGIDGNIYAVAQGNLVVGGLGVEGADGSKVTVNIPSVGRIPRGALVEREVPSPFTQDPEIVLHLHTSDFTTSHRIADTINTAIGMGTALAIDATSIRVRAPKDLTQKVSFVSYLENLTLEPARAPAKVVVNSRTGTVVIGQHVLVRPSAVSHGSLTVTIKERPKVSQPNPFSEGLTTVVPESNVKVKKDGRPMFLFAPGVSLQDIVDAVNRVGASPGDLVAILEALKEVGAIKAELVII